MNEKDQPVEEIVWTGTEKRRRRRGAWKPAPQPAAVAPGQAQTQAQAQAQEGKAAAPAPEAKASAEGAPDGPAAAPASLSNQSRILAETIVASFLDRLKAEAARKGGALTIGDLEALDKEFENKTGALQKVFQSSFEEYVRARERAALERERQYPLDRQIVDKFAHLFPGPDGPSLGDGAISRRILPGFFMAMNVMLGAEVIDEYQDRCRKIVARLQEERGEDFRWTDVYGNDQVNAIALEAVVEMASHFESMVKRGDWFVGMINDNLGPPDPGREGAGSEDWRMDEKDFPRFVEALFSDVLETMSTEAGRLKITKRHGAEACAALAEILMQLENNPFT